jgi:hypothetical protein
LVIFRLQGVSNNATTSLSLPFTNTGGSTQAQFRAENNGTFQTASGLASIAAGVSVISFFLNNTAASFNNTGNKSVFGQILILK